MAGRNFLFLHHHFVVGFIRLVVASTTGLTFLALRIARLWIFNEGFPILDDLHLMVGLEMTSQLLGSMKVPGKRSMRLTSDIVHNLNIK